MDTRGRQGRDVVDGLQIRHAVEEDIALAARSAIRNRTQTLENDSDSVVKFSSSTLSEAIGGLNGVGVLLLSGRKIVLKP